MPPVAAPDDSLAEFDRNRALLFSIAYRMTGSAADAEDLLQEGFIRWQEASARDVRSPKAFLVTIITRLCINHLQSARVRREQYVGPWLPEPIATGTGDPDRALQVDESLSLAFLVLLERLAPRERAVFLLREVFDYDYLEIAAILGQSEANCRQLFSRAQQHLGEARARFSASPEERSRLLAGFLEAVRGGDISGLLDLFSEQVVLRPDGGGKAVAVPNAIFGAANVARAIIGSLQKLVPRNLVSRIAEINGAPAIVSYLNGKPYSVVSLGVGGGRIQEIYVVTNPEKLTRLSDLPATAT